MALPDDMQVVPVVLFKRDVHKLRELVKTRRWSSRSELMRSILEEGVNALFLTHCSFEEAKQTQEKQTEPAAQAA